MIRGENSDSIPIDLITEILSRLPAKSVVRCRCVSKLWGSILVRPYFTDLFLTRSSARPHLLFAVPRDAHHWCFFSSPQPHNPYDKKSSRVVAADFHMKFFGDKTWLEFCSHASGLICYHPEEDEHTVICNPSTGQFARLPLPQGRMKSHLGFDPIDKQFKVLSISVLYDHTAYGYEEKELYLVLTLGTGNDSWREIHCPLNHRWCGKAICINGVLYYLAQTDERPILIVCFDVRSEKFTFIHKDFIYQAGSTELVNYKGKLGVIALEYDNDYRPGTRRSVKLYMRVIKDMEKPEWSEYVCTFLKNQAVGCDVPTFLVNQVVDGWFSVKGVTATGAIVLAMDFTYPSEPFYVIYINPERNTLQSVEIQGLGAVNHGAFEKPRRCEVFVDHVEDFKFFTTKTPIPKKRRKNKKKKISI